MSLEEIAEKGLVVEHDKSGSNSKVVVGTTDLLVICGEKRSEVGLADQRLRAWQGELLVLEAVSVPEKTEELQKVIFVQVLTSETALLKVV
jgi:hypothetical protein